MTIKELKENIRKKENVIAFLEISEHGNQEKIDELRVQVMMMKLDLGFLESNNFSTGATGNYLEMIYK